MTERPHVEFHPEAIEEARAARHWYAARSPAAAHAFENALDTAVLQIAEAPTRWPRHDGATRQFVMRRFPFRVIYFDSPAGVLVLAVAHANRRPGYWRDRLEDAPRD